MFKNIFSLKKPIKGIIGYLKLNDFWESCSKDEQSALIRYYQGGLGIKAESSPICGNISFSSQTKLNYLSAMIGWAISDKNYVLADKLINAGENEQISQHELLDAHYFWQNAAECFYKQRDERSDALELTIKFCLKDIDMFPNYVELMRKEFDTIPRITTFQRLVIFYEKNEQYDKAIDICNLAIKYELTDSTKGGYLSRLEKLKKKLSK